VKAHPIAVTLGLAAAQLLLAALLTSQIIAVAYRDPGVSSVDELSRIGSGPAAAFLAAWLPAVVGIPVALVILVTRYRGRAWTIPAVGMLVSVTCWLWAISTFEQTVLPTA
jgi:hypothetical protein